MLGLHGISVLVVDDDPETLSLYIQALERLGARVLGATDAVSALSILSMWRADVVLCDLHMPEVDGHTLLAQIREQPGLKTLPVIAISGSHPDVEHDRCLREGFSAHLAKPARLSTVVTAIHAVKRPAHEMRI